MTQDKSIKKNQSDGTQKRRWYLLMPVFILLFAFVLDKQFFIWRFPDTFLRTASFISYEHKIDLLDELDYYIKQPTRKKTVIMFGNSRTTHFDNKYIEKNYPDYILFNFSVPGGTPDYYLYMMEKLQKRNIKPDFIYFAITPQGFHSAPSIAMDEVMLEGLSPSFVTRYAYNYKADHLTNFLAKKMFWVYQYRPKLNTIRQRLKNQGLEARIFRTFLAREKMHLISQRGSINLDYQSKPAQDADFLLHTAEGTWKDFLANFKINHGQIDFLERTLSITQKMNISSAMLWVKVGSNLRNFKATRKIVKLNNKKVSIKEFFTPLCDQLAQKYNSDFLDLNYRTKSNCDLFSDSSHMAGWCFREFTDILFTKIQSKLEKK